MSSTGHAGSWRDLGRNDPTRSWAELFGSSLEKGGLPGLEDAIKDFAPNLIERIPARSVETYATSPSNQTPAYRDPQELHGIRVEELPLPMIESFSASGSFCKSGRSNVEVRTLSRNLSALCLYCDNGTVVAPPSIASLAGVYVTFNF